MSEIVDSIMVEWERYAADLVFDDNEQFSLITEGIQKMVENKVSVEKAATFADALDLPEETAVYYTGFLGWLEDGGDSKGSSDLKTEIAKVLAAHCDGTESFKIVFKG